VTVDEVVRRFIREMTELRKRWQQQDEATDEENRKTFGARVGRRAADG
jgi:hypothetical protein